MRILIWRCLACSLSPHIAQSERISREQTVRSRQGIVPDLRVTQINGVRYLAEVKTLHVGASTYMAADLNRDGGAVERRAGRIHKEYHAKAKRVDITYNAHPEDSNIPGPVRRQLQSYGRIRGFVFGAFGEVSKDVQKYTEELAEMGSERTWRDMGARSQMEAKNLIRTMIRESIGIEAVRGNARLLLDRLAVMSGDAAKAKQRREGSRFGWWQRRHLRSRLQGFGKDYTRFPHPNRF